MLPWAWHQAPVVAWFHAPWDWFAEASVEVGTMYMVPACVTASLFNSSASTCVTAYHTGWGPSTGRASVTMRAPIPYKTWEVCSYLLISVTWSHVTAWEIKKIHLFKNYLQFCKSNTGLLPRLIPWDAQLERRKVFHGNSFIKQKWTITVWEQKAATVFHKLARGCNLLKHGCCGRIWVVYKI